MEGSSRAGELLASLATHPDLDPDALRALIKATRLLGFACGAQLAEYRNSGEPLQMVFAEVRRLALLARSYETVSRIQAERWQKVPERRRPHYTPYLRFQILELKSLLGLSQKETAQLFAISRNTVARWEQEVAANPGKETVGSLVKPNPPVRRYADVVRRLIHTMRVSGFGGCRKIAQTLARAGWKISKRAVGRILKETPPKTPIPRRTADSPRALRARHPNHIWMADITTIPSLFRLFSFKLVVVLDVFSRMPLAAKVFWKEPSARQMGRLIQRAALRFGPPRHFVSDKGKQLTAKRIRKMLLRFGTRQRFGAVGRYGSISIIERLWRTLKDKLRLRSFKPLTKRELERRLELGLYHYTHLRPHQGLGGATPAEIYFGRDPVHLAAVYPPRARPREGPTDSPFEIAYLDPDKMLPVLIRKAA
ncbi:MAG: transposase [Vicinamibacteria bacterium]